MGITLQDLIRPLELDTFVREHFLAGKHHLSKICDSTLAELATVPEFRALDALLGTPVKVQLLGANGFRALCPRGTARAFFDEGYVLYMTHVHTAVPQARDLVEGICAVVGIHPRYVRLEAFAGKAGAISSMHYDHDFNFHVLLRGSKRWRVQPNAHIDNPLESHHDLDTPKDELYASALPLPRTFSSPEVLAMEAGSCLFFPSGYWHEVESLGATFAVNIVLDPPRMHEVLAKALEHRLGWTSGHRGFAFGLLGDGVAPALGVHARATFEEAREAALELMRGISPEDASVAHEETRYRWSSPGPDRRVEAAGPDSLRIGSSAAADGYELDMRFGALLERLLLVEGSFDLHQLCAWAPGVAGEEMLAVVLELIGHGVLERAPSSSSRGPQEVIAGSRS